MAGWRVGMMIGNEKVLKQALKVKSNMDSGMLFGIQQGAIEALNMTLKKPEEGIPDAPTTE